MKLTPLRLQLPCQLRHRQQWGIAGDSRGQKQQPTVTQSDRSAVAGATPVGSILLSVSFAFGTPFRTYDSLGIRTQRPVARQPVSTFLRTRSQCPKENHWTTARFRTAPFEASSHLIETKQLSHFRLDLCDSVLIVSSSSAALPAPPPPKFQETPVAKTTAQGGQGIPSLCAVRPSCRRPLGVH